MTDPAQMHYCPKCSRPLSDGLRFGHLRRVCESCGFIHFRDPKVAAVVLISQTGQLLLVKRASSPEIGKWSLPGGYIDYGEDPRAAAIREVREETGLDIRITNLIDVMGGDGIGGASIIILFEAEPVGGSLSPADDAEEVVLFSPDDLPPLDQIAAFTSTRLMLEYWLSQQISGK